MQLLLPRTRSRRRAARSYATQASIMSARRLDCSSPQLRMPTTAAIPPIQIRIENVPMTPAMHPQKNEAARATRTPMRARSNHSGIAKSSRPVSLGIGDGYHQAAERQIPEAYFFCQTMLPNKHSGFHRLSPHSSSARAAPDGVEPCFAAPSAVPPRQVDPPRTQSRSSGAQRLRGRVCAA
jgi:hypothetical protein